MTQDFVHSQKDALVSEIKPDGRKLAKFKMSGPLPEVSEDLAVDAVAGLRATLDYAAYASAVALGAVRPKSAYFPFADSAAELKNTIKGRCKDLHPNIVTLFESFEPYKGGSGNALWSLNKLRQVAEHASIVAVSFHTQDGSLEIPSGVDPADVSTSNFIWDSEKHEVIIAEFPARAPGEEDLKYHFQFTLKITFPQAPTLEEAAAGDLLEQLSGVIGGIADATEAETRKLMP